MEAKVWNLIDSGTLCWGADWEGSESSVRALVFGKMVGLGQNRIERYQSDLFHDAIWLRENLTGPMQFDWIARASGTFIGEVCSHVKTEDYENSVYYRFEIVEEDRKWTLNIYEASPAPPTDIDYSENEAYQLQQEKEVIPWIDRHAALGISECDVAKAIEGCIFHPAPVGGWTVEEATYGNDEPNEQTLADAEDALKVLDPNNATIDLLFGAGNKFPTLRNETTRKGNSMESIIRDLRDKYEEASNSKDQLEEYQSNIGEAVDELDTYMSDLDDLISSLDQLPEVSVYVDLDTVSFDS